MRPFYTIYTESMHMHGPHLIISFEFDMIKPYYLKCKES